MSKYKPKNEPMNTLRELRQQQGLSANALAKRSGVSRPAITYIEEGRHRPNHRTIAALADALGVDPADLTGTPQTQTTTIYLVS